MIDGPLSSGFDRKRILHMLNNYPHSGLIHGPKICNRIIVLVIHFFPFFEFGSISRSVVFNKINTKGALTFIRAPLVEPFRRFLPPFPA